MTAVRIHWEVAYLKADDEKGVRVFQGFGVFQGVGCLGGWGASGGIGKMSFSSSASYYIA